MANQFSEEELKKQNDLMTELNLQMRNLNDGSTEYNRSIVKQNQNFAKVLDRMKSHVILTGDGKQAYQKMQDAVENIADGQKSINDLIKLQNKAIIDGNKSGQLAYGTALRRARVEELNKKSLSAIDTLTGSMGTKAMDALSTFRKLGPAIGMMAIGLTLSLALLKTFEAQSSAIADTFGAIGVTEMRDDLAKASQDFTQLTLEAKDANSAISDLANNFGIALSSASQMADSVGRLSIVSAITVDESAKLIGLFTKTQGLSAEQAENLLKSTQSLAKANDVAPDKVLKDVATNTEFFAKYSKDGGENILRAAIQARKLGLELSTVEKIADSLLQFQTSLQSEIEASVIIGRRVNLQRARELSLAGETEELQKEIVKQVGSEAEFNKMNVLQRQALASALSLEVKDLQKLVSGQKQSVTLQGQLAKQDISKMVPEETIVATAALIANLKTMGMQLAESVGPALSSVVGIFAGFAKILADFNLMLPAFIGLMGIMALKSIHSAGMKKLDRIATQELISATISQTAAQQALNVTKTKGNQLALTGAGTSAIEVGANRSVTSSNLTRAGSNVAVGATKAATSLPFPFNILSTVASAATLMGVVMTAMSSASGIPRFKSIEGTSDAARVVDGMAIADANESIVDSNLLDKALQNNSTGTSVTDTSKLESKQDKGNELLDRMLTTLDGALGGPRPALARAMGSSVGDTILTS